MLTNENSVSAAMLFPALLIRNGRGVTVGRETRGAYHFMNAVKFVDVRLPASLVTVRLTLVETHFDSVVNERTPYGHGVMPDYPLPLSVDEILSDGDMMLDHALKLIKKGKYFRKKPQSLVFADKNYVHLENIAPQLFWVSRQ